MVQAANFTFLASIQREVVDVSARISCNNNKFISH